MYVSKTLPVATAFALWSAAVHAQSATDAIITQYQDLGFQYIEIKEGVTQTKVEAIMAYHSQFHNPKNPDQVVTHISEPRFLKFLEARWREHGHSIGVEFGEGFTKGRQIGVTDLWGLTQQI